MSKASILRILSTDDIIARTITKMAEEPGQYRVKAKFKCPGINGLTEACAIIAKAEVEAEEQHYRIEQAKALIVFDDGMTMENRHRFTVINAQKRSRYFVEGWLSKGSNLWPCDCPVSKHHAEFCKHAIACELFVQEHKIQFYESLSLSGA